MSSPPNAPPEASPTPSPEDELEGSRAPFLDHLEELRWRLWKALVGVIAAGTVCYLFREEIFGFLTDPLFATLEKRHFEGAIKFRTVSGAFMFHFKTAILGGIFFGIPIVLYQGWQFVAPGLYKTERRVALPFVALSSICFVGGGAFAYYLVLPEAFDFLLGYAIDQGGRKMLPDITVEDYLGFTTKLLLAFGIIFEMPVAVGFLSAVGLVTHHVLIKYWRFAVVGAFIVGALLTPPDYVTQTMLAVPLCGLYGISIGIAWFFTKRRAEAAAALDAEYADDPRDDDAPPPAGGGAPG
ncbi:MAG: twin-arginine translocase subunit TatC [Myxococcales bacterium]|nr:twin-arginine translocase subunit TatC [Myxococcales bacterium]